MSPVCEACVHWVAVDKDAVRELIKPSMDRRATGGARDTVCEVLREGGGILCELAELWKLHQRIAGSFEAVPTPLWHKRSERAVGPNVNVRVCKRREKDVGFE